ncbi:MAG: hypothetical protein HYR60_02115 [Acidobacteria bacterium]|nr:hypothetical protein [Acidobacteriota bacterium]
MLDTLSAPLIKAVLWIAPFLVTSVYITDITRITMGHMPFRRARLSPPRLGAGKASEPSAGADDPLFMQLTNGFSRLCMLTACLLAWMCLPVLRGAEAPYLVTYGHRLEEPGNLEIATHQVAGSPKGGNSFLNTLMEIEYGVKSWWTTELYLSGQGTRHEGAVFTGYRIENRFRPLLREHWINPVLYIEWVDVNGADKSLREVVGHDTFEDQLEPNSETRHERKREVEGKLILSSNFKGWNVSENFIAEKIVNHAEPWEFGYAIGVSRPLAMKAKPYRCNFCAENFHAGVEVYGGLGTRHEFGLRGTSHYLAPIIAWTLPNNTTLEFSPGFGLNQNSHGVLWRFTVAREFNQFGRWLRGMR